MTTQSPDFSLSDPDIWGGVHQTVTLIPTVGTTYTGAIGPISGSASVAVGLQASLDASSGSASLQYPVAVHIGTPASIEPGGVLQISTSLLNVGAVDLTAQSPSLSASLDLVGSVQASASLLGYTIGYPSSGQSPNFDFQLASIGPGTSIDVSLGPVSFNAQLPEQVTSSSDVQTTFGALPSFEADASGTVLSATGDIVEALKDFGVTGLDALSGSIPFSGISYDLLKADLIGDLDLVNQETFDPSELDVTLTPNFPGSAETVEVGQPLTFQVPANWTAPVTFSVSYKLTGQLSSVLGIEGQASLELSALSGTDLFGSFGPLLGPKTIPLYKSGVLPLLPTITTDESLDQSGGSITIPVDLAQNPTPITSPGPINGGSAPAPVVSAVNGKTSVSYPVGQEIPLSSLFSAAEQPVGSGQSPVAYDLLLPQAGGGQFVIGGAFYSGNVTNATASEVANGYFWTGNSPGTNQIDVIAIDGLGNLSTPLAITVGVTAASAPIVTSPSTSGVGPLIDNSIAEPFVNVGSTITLTEQDLYALDQGVPTIFSDMVYTVTTLPVHGALQRSGVTLTTSTTFTQTDINSGLITYVENGDNASADSFQYYVTDASGDRSSVTTYHLSIDPTATISAVPDPTLVNDGSLVVGVGQTVELTDQNLDVTDGSLPSWQLIYKVTQGPSLGTVGAAAIGTFTQQELDDGLVWYQSNGLGTGADHFTFTVTNSEGGTIGPATLNVNVIPKNNITILAIDPVYTNPQGEWISGMSIPGYVTVLSSDLLLVQDPGVDPSQIKYTVDSLPANGAILIGTWNTPSSTPTFNGTDFDSSEIASGSQGSFTQAQVDAGQVYYRQISGSYGDQFPMTLTVSDNAGNSLSNITVPVMFEAAGFLTGGIFTNYTEIPTPTMSASIGETTLIGDNTLQVVAEQIPNSQIIYSVWYTPQSGALLLNGTPLTANATFTQADVDAGRLAYVENGAAVANDQFGLKVNVPPAEFPYVGSGLLSVFSVSVQMTGTDGGAVLSDNSGGQILYSGPGNNWVIGQTGTAALSYANAPSGVSVDLATGTASNGFSGTDTITGVNTVIGSAFDDTLVGGLSSTSTSADTLSTDSTTSNTFVVKSSLSAAPASQTFLGGAGDNTITGGSGVLSTAAYAGPLANYQVTYNDGSLTVSSPSNDDSLTNIQTLQFSDVALTTLDSNATAAVAQFNDSTGTGHIFIQSGTTVSAGTGSAFAPNGLDLGGTIGGEGDASVTGTGALLSNVGQILIGDVGFGSLSILSGGTVTAVAGSGLAGAVIANTSTASGSSVNVSGAGSNWLVTGSLIVGNAGQGLLNLSQGATVSAGSVDEAAAAGSDGVISVAGTGSALNVTGQLMVGDHAAGELSILGGASVSAMGVIVGGASPLSSGNIDIEGAGSELLIGTGGVLNIGVTGGGSGGLTVGNGATLHFNGTPVEAGNASLNNNGGTIDPDSFEYTTLSNTGNGLNEYNLFLGNIGAIQINTGTGTWNSPAFLTGTSAADAATNIGNGDQGLWQIGAGGTLVMNANTIDAGQVIQFGTNSATLVIGQIVNDGAAGAIGVTPTISVGAANMLPDFAAQIWGYVTGDNILFNNLTVSTDSVVNGNTVDLFDSGHTLLGSLTFYNKNGTPNAAANTAAQAAAAQIVPCYAAGTLIETVSGPRAVETLREGDEVRTLLGGPGRIGWIGTRTVNCARHPRPEKVWPIRVCRNAFGPGLPKRDLFLSPDHAVYVNDVLIPVHLLVNGTTIRQVERASVTYYHVELAQHDVVLAEGLPAESYLDTGDRSHFANGGGVMSLHPEFGAGRRSDENARVWEMAGCAPLVVTGDKLTATRASLAEWAIYGQQESPNHTAFITSA